MKTTKIIGFIVLTLLATFSFAANISPVGKWQTISDKTGKPRSIIQITESHDKLYGKIITVYKEEGDTGYCQNCPGKFKGKKVLGLTIMWGLNRTGAREWDGGKILDPKTGSVYSCKITVAPDGKTLKIRGYYGISLLGRTQTWVRVSK